MIDVIGKEILLESFKAIFEKLLDEVINGYFDTTEKKTRLAEAMAAINQAILQTRKFIDNEGFVSNTELSKLWHEALNKSVAAGLKELPEYLYHKADFWGEPQEWLNNKASLEIVPKLEDLKRYCDNIMVRLKK